MKCRHCGKSLHYTILDLGFAPPSNAYLTAADLDNSEKYYPLRLKVCEECWLVQVEEFSRPVELFGPDYAYFSSTSTSWLVHAASYAEKITRQLSLDCDSMVVEIASNDGYLLRNFVAEGIHCLGIEPTAGTATVAENRGIPVLREFFCEKLGRQLAYEDRQGDLIIGNNVYAHVPDINDFTRGLKAALKPEGTITLEFPHLMRLLEFVQFDTVYHEHFSYLSLYTVKMIFESVGLKISHVEELSTHGGSIRVYGCHKEDFRQPTDEVFKLLEEEKRRGMQALEPYIGLQEKVNKIKDDLLLFLIEQKRLGKKVAAYGAAAKGNTLLNYAGIKPDLLPFVCDAAESKQGKYLPGSHIPIYPPAALIDVSPDYLLILPWNIAPEIRRQNARLLEFGTRFVTAVPALEIS